ncbi:L,D-transpeptidase [Leptolyngbya cf. ectocarpi LEGE 11479]|uniref:L,D-transpeptidase n=1 Tax=Leptolyngbya cf. ectocarpi LEGE 11479 TaxID=1828722 RepID=A0A929FCK7_LEPEC|nr:L,D-transpeptidase [Leptolyngbya ectocarpi]MBE9070162.1 L,D-transpeptidase [Leptolyngbya cf. ectocarpi LEGE 11479]
MTKAVRSVIVGLTVPLWGLLVLPSAAQIAVDANPPVFTVPTAGAVKPPASEIIKWPPPVSIEQPVALPVTLVLQLSQRQLHVYRGDTLETMFPVAVGKTGWETPTGTFEVSYMLENPGWTNPFTGEVLPPGPENPLGERWISFWTDGQNEIGFHGTPNRGSIGQASSHGCVRLYNEHIRELYDLVTPGTLVTVLP